MLGTSHGSSGRYTRPEMLSNHAARLNRPRILASPAQSQLVLHGAERPQVEPARGKVRDTRWNRRPLPSPFRRFCLGLLLPVDVLVYAKRPSCDPVVRGSRSRPSDSCQPKCRRQRGRTASWSHRGISRRGRGRGHGGCESSSHRRGSTPRPRSCCGTFFRRPHPVVIGAALPPATHRTGPGTDGSPRAGPHPVVRGGFGVGSGADPLAGLQPSRQSRRREALLATCTGPTFDPPLGSSGSQLAIGHRCDGALIASRLQVAPSLPAAQRPHPSLR
jgi:hypothetical protein